MTEQKEQKAQGAPGEKSGEGSGEERALPFVVKDRRFWVRKGDDEVEGEERPRKPTVLEELERRLAEKDKELAGILSKYRRAREDFEQAQARLTREISRELEVRKRSFFLEILEGLDNLDRALEVGERDPDPRALLDGVRLVRDQFQRKLKNLGLEKRPALGQSFDPALHEAISVIPVTEGNQDGKVVGVVSDCYIMGEEVLRPAQVAVGKLSG